MTDPHEPSEACAETHCHWHGVDESDAGAYRVCGECGHVCRTAEDLRKAWAGIAAFGPRASRRGPDVTAPPAEEIYGCPLCAHDW